MLLYQKEKQSEIIVFGVDKNIFHENIPVKKLKEDLNIKSRNVILSPRSMVENSNIDQIIKAIPIVLKEIPDAIFIFKYNFGHLNTKMKLLSQKLGIIDSVRFIGYISDFSLLPAYYKIATVSISIPSSDSTARAWFESIACGTPLILSDIPNVHEWFEDRESALIVPLHNSNLLAERIVEIIKNNKLRLQILNKSKLITDQKADFYKNMDKMNKIYQSL